MKTVLAIGATLVALIVAPALAADMAAPVLKAPAPVWNWTGFYVGLNAGGGFGRVNVDDEDCYWCNSTHATSALPLPVASSVTICNSGRWSWAWKEISIGLGSGHLTCFVNSGAAVSERVP
jgi:opacity protein-like surface antigen